MTEPPPDPPRRTCIEEAAILVAAESGAVDRIRARHRARADGTCRGCGATPVRWPCVHVAIADHATEAR